VFGVLPVVAPTPTLSNAMTRRCAASASIRAGSRLSRSRGSAAAGRAGHDLHRVRVCV